MKIELMEKINNDFPTLYFMHKQSENKHLPEKVAQKVKKLIEANRFKDKSGTATCFDIDDFSYIIVVLDEAEKVEDHDFRLAIFNALQLAQSNNFKNLNIVSPDFNSSSMTIKKIATMIYIALYQYDEFKTDKDSKEAKLENFTIITDHNGLAQQNALAEAKILGKSSTISRRLVDAPPNVLNAKELAKRVEKLGKEVGFDVEVFKEEKIRKFGMGAYLAVAQGSANRPRLIVMRYFGNKDSKDVLGFVGKGLTYDSGGYNLKPATGLLTMKSDMGGAAAVIGAMHAIAKSKLEVNVVAVVAACENAISSTSYRPDDILTTMAGKTILCENTDAEGRFTLIDAITYIQRKEKATKIVDMATLTGAAIVCLGNAAAVTVSNNDDFYNSYQKAAEAADEKIWRMPIFKEYKEQLKSKVADYTNTPGNPGSVTAGMLLQEFVEEEKPWIHVDIAPVAFQTKKVGYYNEGASGYGAISLFELAKSEQK